MQIAAKRLSRGRHDTEAAAWVREASLLFDGWASRLASANVGATVRADCAGTQSRFGRSFEGAREPKEIERVKGKLSKTPISNSDTSHLRLLIDAVVDYAVYMIDLQGRVASWNAGAERLKGYKAEEIIGQPFSTFFTADDRANELPKRAMEIAARTGKFETEGWRVRKDGTRFWALAVLDAMRDESGALIGFAKITRDMTQRQLEQNKLLESERRFRHLVQAVVDYAIFQIDPTGVVATWNSGAERIKGYKADEIIGHHFSQFYTEEDRAAGNPERALATAARQGRFESEGWRVRKDGTRFWASAVIDAIRDDDGELVGFAKVTRDVTERREAHLALQQAQEQLAASLRMDAVGQLSGGIAHDFNNLLMIVIGNLDRAQRTVSGMADIPGAPNLRRSLDGAMRGAQRATSLTHRLLAFSRRQPLNPRPVDLNKYLSETGDFLQRTLGETIQVEIVGAGGLWPIEVDSAQLESALVNVAINARDAMPNGGKLTIEALNTVLDREYNRSNPEVTPGQYVLICVSDTGTGIPKDTLDRVFEPFFTTKEAGQGTGLGLSQVYGFVKQSGGHIKIYSEVGQGTTVKFYFPRLVADRGVSAEGGISDPIDGGEGCETILIVEDDRDVRVYLVEVLRDLNYRAIAAQDAVAAIGIVENLDIQVDLILSDVVMPGMNGRELVRRAKQLRPKLKVLFMSGYSRNAIVHHGRIDRDIEFVQKPVSQAELGRRLRELLDRLSD